MDEPFRAAPDRARGRLAARRCSRRRGRLPLAAARVLARLVLPHGRHGVAHRPRHAARTGTAALLITIALALSAAWQSSATSRPRVVEADRPRRAHRRRSTDEAEDARRSSSLRDHFIICGYGRVGRRVGRGVPRRRAQPFVVLDFSAGRDRRRAASAACLYIEGSGTEDDDLEARRASSARAGSSPRPTPTPTTSTSRSRRAARRAGPDDRRARLRREDAARKLRLAGADRVVQPYSTAGTGDGEARAQAAGGRVPRPRLRRRGGPDLRFEEIEVTPELPAGRAGRSASSASASTTGAIVIALRKPDGTLRHDAEPGRRLDVGDVLIAIGTEPTSCRRSRSCSRPARPLPPRAARARPAATARSASSRARASSSSGPTNGRARRLRDERRAADGAGARPARRASSPRSSRPAAAELPEVERAEVAGPGLPQPLARPTRSSARRSRRSSGRGYGGGSAEPPRARPGRDGLRQPDRPDHGRARRGTAPTATRSRGCSSSPATTVEREYYYNDAGAQMERFRALGRGARGAARSRPRTATRATYIAELAARAGRSGAARCSSGSRRRSSASAIHFDSWAQQSVARARAPRAPRAARRPTRRDGALWARTTEFGDDKDRVLVRSAGRAACRPTSAADVAYLARQARARLRPRDLRARRRPPRRRATGTRRSRGCSATTPSRVEVLLYQLVHLTSGGEQAKMSKRRGDVVFLDELHRRDRRRRRALVPRLPRPRPDDRDRRRPRAPSSRRRTRSTTSSTRTRGSPGSCATPATRRLARRSPGRSRPRSASS